MRYILLVFLAIIIHGSSYAQDVQYSQFYAAPMYLNPAFTGATELTRVGANYRKQWPGLNHSFNSYSAYIDHYMYDINSGIGLIINGDKESMAGLSTMEIGALYSYRLQLGMESFLHVGGQAGFVSRDAFFSDLVFGSQLDINSGTVGNITDELPLMDTQLRFADFNFGMLYYNEKIWLGASAHHLSQPNQSFLEDGISALPVKYSMHGGVKFALAPGEINNFFNNTHQERSLSLAFNYKQQNPFHQVDIGAQLLVEPLVLGLWYRGVPVQYSLPNYEAIIALMGLSLENGMDIGYSYDFTVSNLGIGNSAGAHEISIRYSFLYGDPKDRNQRRTVLSCFKY
jgi:type IX secretion system PorP/SprF family membrane protein